MSRQWSVRPCLPFLARGLRALRFVQPGWHLCSRGKAVCKNQNAVTQFLDENCDTRRKYDVQSTMQMQTQSIYCILSNQNPTVMTILYLTSSIRNLVSIFIFDLFHIKSLDLDWIFQMFRVSLGIPFFLRKLVYFPFKKQEPLKKMEFLNQPLIARLHKKGDCTG